MNVESLKRETMRAMAGLVKNPGKLEVDEVADDYFFYAHDQLVASLPIKTVERLEHNPKTIKYASEMLRDSWLRSITRYPV